MWRHKPKITGKSEAIQVLREQKPLTDIRIKALAAIGSSTYR